MYSMSYSVRLTDAANRKVSGWRLSSHQIREILRGLDALADNPARQLIRVGPPYDALYFDWVVSEIGRPDRDVLYTFTVRYATDEETLWIVDCDRMFGDPTT
jgi:hypothetical protein